MIIVSLFRSSRSGFTCILALPFNSIWLLPVLHLFQIHNCPLFLVQSFVRANFEISLYIFILYIYSFQNVCLEDAHFGEGELWLLLICREFSISPQQGLQRWWIMSIFQNCNLVLPMLLPLHTFSQLQENPIPWQFPLPDEFLSLWMLYPIMRPFIFGVMSYLYTLLKGGEILCVTFHIALQEI